MGRCSLDFDNTGASLLCKGNLTDILKPIVAKGTYSMTLINAELEATWLAAYKAIVGSRLYPFPAAYNSEPANIEQEYKQQPFGGTRPGKAGFEGVTLTYEGVTPAKLKKWKSFNNKNTKAYLVDEKKNILGWKDGANFKPFDVMYHVEDFRVADNMRIVKVRIELSNPVQLNENGYVIEPDFDVLAHEGVNDVTLVISSPVVGGCTVTVTDTLSGNPIEGLVAADFVIKKGVSAVTVASATEGAAGVYALVFNPVTTAGSHTANLVACASISLTDLAIEATETAFTV